MIDRDSTGTPTRAVYERAPSATSGSAVDELELPTRAEPLRRQLELDRLVVAVEEQEEGVVDDGLALRRQHRDLLAVQEHADRVRVAALQSRCVMRRPSGRNHQTSGRSEPSPPCPRGTRGRRKAGCSRRSCMSRRVNSNSSRWSSSQSQSNHESSLSWHHALLLPCCVRAELVAAEEHRHALREEQRREEVALLARRSSLISGSSVGPSTPQFHDRLSSVPSLVVLEVRLVVLVVVGDEVAQREAVVRGDEVDRRERAPAVRS